MLREAGSDEKNGRPWPLGFRFARRGTRSEDRSTVDPLFAVVGCGIDRWGFEGPEIGEFGRRACERRGIREADLRLAMTVGDSEERFVGKVSHS